jgi:hypothetical protein
VKLTAVHFVLGPLPQIIALSVVTVLGTTLAIRRRASQPASSWLVVLGSLLILLDAVGEYAIRIDRGSSFERYQDAFVHGQHLAETHAVLNSSSALGVILLVAAVFADRAVARRIEKHRREAAIPD